MSAEALLSVGSAKVEPVAAGSIPVSISGVLDLFAFQFDLAYDPSVVNLVSISEGPFLPSAGGTFFLPGTIDNVAGTATFISDSLLGPVPGASGSGDLVFLKFVTACAGCFGS